MRNLTTSIEALKKLATFPSDAMLQEVGPLALVQRPVGGAAPTAATLHLQLSRTVPNESRPKVAQHALSLILDLAHGLVVTLGREDPEGTLVLGRSDDCDVQLSDASVSAHHASVRWDGWKRAAWLTDLKSTNGTLIDGRKVSPAELELHEGNVLTLGNETSFLFLRTETLYALLHQR